MKNFKLLVFFICLLNISNIIKASFGENTADLSIVIEEKKCKCCEKECGECLQCKKCYHSEEKTSKENYKNTPIWKKIMIPYGFLFFGITSGIFLIYKIASKCDFENLKKAGKLTEIITYFGSFIVQIIQLNIENKIKITSKTDKI